MLTVNTKQGESLPDQTRQAAHSRSMFFSPAKTASIAVAVTQAPKSAWGKPSDHCRRSGHGRMQCRDGGRRIDDRQTHFFGLHHVLGQHGIFAARDSMLSHSFRCTPELLCSCLFNVQPATKALRAILIYPTWARITVH
jgi:hypothetical protein